MGSYITSEIPASSPRCMSTDEVSDDIVGILKEDEKSLSSLLPIEVSSRQCSFCLNDLPEDGVFVTCKYCQKNFHFGKCSLKQPKGNENKPYKKWTCPKCKKRGRKGDPYSNKLRDKQKSHSSNKERPTPTFLQDIFRADISGPNDESKRRHSRRRGIRVPKKPVFMPRMRAPAPPPFPF